MMKVLIDSNMLLAIVQFKVDVFGQLEKAGHNPVVLSCVIEELKKISKGKGKDPRAAGTILRFLEKNKIRIRQNPGPVDSALLELATENGWAVATNDIVLIKKLKAADVEVIRLRQRKLFDLP